MIDFVKLFFAKMSKRSRAKVDYSGMDPSLRDFNFEGDFIGNSQKPRASRSSRRLVMSDIGTSKSSRTLRFFEDEENCNSNLSDGQSDSSSNETDEECEMTRSRNYRRPESRVIELAAATQATQFTQFDQSSAQDSVPSDSDEISDHHGRVPRKKLKLRQKARIDYEKQLMPRNFTQVLDKEFPLSKPKTPLNSPKKEKLNDEEREKEPTSRINGFLNQTEYRSFLPINIKEIVHAEETRLLELVSDENIKREYDSIHSKSGVHESIDFDSVAGLEKQKQALQEMVILPLLYPHLFQGRSAPPKGVIFHGPPGTGKTMIARALASSCCTTGKRPVAFFLRKGADVLNKWVGESERQLRLLFDQAKLWQPSIIFFDEIDGLAPVRNSKQDQIHSSIVSTLLSLMDGLDGRGQVVVIAATNRIDSVDPALRRPGRFDREFYFGLPTVEARMKII